MNKAEIERLRENYGRALRAWHVAWLARVEWHARTFRDLEVATQGVIYQWAIDERSHLQVAEEHAYNRFLNARAILEQALRSARG